MAAITNQDKAWKQIWMDRAEKITDIWDIFKAWCGRSAEVVLSICMFVSIIGVLPGVHYWPWVGNLILSIQIIMLDMGGFAMNTLAENARDNGQEEAAQKAEKMGRFLIQLVIATLALITIGQLAAVAGPYEMLVQKIVGYIETSLILVRVVSTVAYIHTIHSLRGSTLQVAPAAPQPDDLAEQLRNELSTQYDQQLENLRVQLQDVTTLLLTQSASYSSAPSEDTMVSTQMTSQETPVRESVRTQSSSKVTRKLSTPSNTKVFTTDAQKRAARVLKKFPTCTPSELAQRAQISKSYASKILAEATQKGN